jgi:uncharacterized repeat protein (TIGR02543 family)
MHTNHDRTQQQSTETNGSSTAARRHTMNTQRKLMATMTAVMALILVVPNICEAGESPQYTGPAETRADLAHDGQLPWAVGASSYQVVRSVPSNPSATDGTDTDFRHHHYIAWWEGRFWVYHLAGRHTAESSIRGRLNWSADGMTWANADSAEIFPHATHQRAAFYVASNNVFLVTTWYSQNGNAGRGGVGSRLVRRINGPGDFGPIHVLKHNHKGAATIPGGTPALYSASSDAAFKTACAELLDNKLYRQQFQEEDQDPAFYVVNGALGSPMARAFNWYTRNNGEIVGLWKFADTVATAWDFGQVPAPQDYATRLKLAGSPKIWGCKTSDGRFALVGNPSVSPDRFPLVVSTSADGITFGTPYATVEGDMDPLRYPNPTLELFGDLKNSGHQYVRGIEEGFPKPTDSNEWLVTSQNKEDIWVTRVPAPIVTRVTGPVSDGFQSVPPGGAVPQWNLRSEQWATVKVAQEGDNRFLRLTDKAQVGYAKAFRVFETVAASGGNNFGWSASGNALGTAGEAGGIFARSQAYSTFADTTIGTLNRTGSTLRMTGSFRLANDSFDGHFYLGYFDPASLVSGSPPANFVGIRFEEPAANAADPFRGGALVTGTGGNVPATINLTQNTPLAFDLTWTGGANGSGTLSGTLAGQAVNVAVGAGTGNFTAFGLLSGGMANGDPARKTAGCHFDNLGYTTSGGLASETFDTAASTAANGWSGFTNGAVADLSFRLRPLQANHGCLEVDVMDRKGQRPVRLAFDATGAVLANSGQTMSQVASYSAAQWLDVAIRVDMNTGTYSLRLGGTPVGGNRTLATSNGSVERLEFRTGAYRLNDFTRRASPLPTDTLSGADTMVTEAVFDIDDVATSPTYTVSYDANGATSGTAPAAQTKTHDVPLTLATNSGNLAKTGFTFAGWNTLANGSGADYAAGESYTANAAVTLYAKWTANTYAAWAASQSPPVTGGPNGDDNNNGIPNLIEYALADGQARGTLRGTTLSFTKRGAPWGSDITYSIETSADLGISDPWQAVKPNVNDDSTISYTLPNPGDNFARLRVSQYDRGTGHLLRKLG